MVPFLIGAFAFFPTVIGNRLRAMGVETFDVAGMKITLAQAKAATAKAAGHSSATAWPWTPC